MMLVMGDSLQSSLYACVAHGGQLGWEFVWQPVGAGDYGVGVHPITLGDQHGVPRLWGDGLGSRM